MPLSFATFVAATPEVATGLRLETAAITDLPPAPWHAAAFDASWRAGSLAVVTAIERTGAPERDDAAPGVLWGTRGLRTNARTAALLTGANGWSEAVIVNETIVVDAHGGPIAELSSQTRLARARVTQQVAPTVHQVAEEWRNERSLLVSS